MEKNAIIKKIQDLMRSIVPDIPIDFAEETLLEELYFDTFSCNMLAFELEQSEVICIPDKEVDKWQTFGDIIESVERHQY